MLLAITGEGRDEQRERNGSALIDIFPIPSPPDVHTHSSYLHLHLSLSYLAFLAFLPLFLPRSPLSCDMLLGEVCEDLKLVLGGLMTKDAW